MSCLRAILCLSCIACGTSGDSAEDVALIIQEVTPSGDECLYEGSAGAILAGRFDLISLVAPGGAVGNSRRYVIGVKWARLREGDRIDDGKLREDFVILQDVEVRLVYKDRVVTEPTEETQNNLPATYVVPTMGSEDFGDPPPAVFDLIPTWVARRLALDAHIWAATTASGVPAPGKDYLLPIEFRLRGSNIGGRKVRSNWFRWVVSLCRGCQIAFTSTPPQRPFEGVPVFPGNYTSEELGQTKPLPRRPGIVRWCTAGAFQGTWVLDLVQPSQPLEPRSY